MIEAQLPILIIALPLIAAPLCVLLGNRRLVYLFSLLVSWCTFGISLWLMAKVIQGGTIRYDLGNWEPPYGIEYVVDSLSAFVMLFVSGLGAIVLLYAPPSVDQEIPEKKQYLFYASYLLCLTGLLGICITGDLFNVFVFLEISSLSSYALISMGRTRRAPLAAFQYLIMGTIGATFILIGIGLVYQMTGTLNMADMFQSAGKGRVDGHHVRSAANPAGGVCIPDHRPVYQDGRIPVAYVAAQRLHLRAVGGHQLHCRDRHEGIGVRFIRTIYGIFTPEFAFEVSLPLANALMVLSLVGIFVRIHRRRIPGQRKAFAGLWSSVSPRLDTCCWVSVCTPTKAW